MENSEQEFANEMYKLFIERRLAKNKMPIKDLTRLIQGLQKYKKKECAEMIDVLKMVFIRKKELQLHDKKIQQELLLMFWQKFNLNKDKEQAYRFFKLFYEVNEWSESDVCDGPYVLDKPYSTDEEDQEERRIIRETVVELENIKKKSLKDFTQLHLYLIKVEKINFAQMPIQAMARFVEGLTKFKGEETCLIDRLKIGIAYKQELKKVTSEEQSKRNKEFIQKQRSLKVEQNEGSDKAFWKQQFEMLDAIRKEGIKDGLYIEGLIPEQKELVR